MTYLFLAAFIAGLLLGVRVMFFGAERRRRSADGLPLRRSEPAIVGFLLMFGVAGYLLTRRGTVSPGTGALIAALLGLVWAILVTRLAVATARLERVGVDAVESSGLCTSCNAELFYSYRRDGERAGRQAGLVWMN